MVDVFHYRDLRKTVANSLTPSVNIRSLRST